jgi:hypothetical protein
VEAFRFIDGTAALFLHGHVPPTRLGTIEPTSFDSIPEPQHGFLGTAAELARVAASLESAHRAFVCAAATTSKGAPRRTSFARYHSPGLLTYAQRVDEDSRAALSQSAPVADCATRP